MDCIICGAKKRSIHQEGDPVIAPEYCSGKCQNIGLEKFGNRENMMATEVQSQAGEIINKAMERLNQKVPMPGSYADYCQNPDKYHRRLNAEKLNWGVHLSVKQLRQAGLKENREPIPGDWDFGPSIVLPEEPSEAGQMTTSNGPSGETEKSFDELVGAK